MARKTLLALTALVAAGAYADNTSYDVNAGCSNDQLLRWYDEDIGLFLYPNGAYYFWQAGVMITAVASLAALDSGVKSRTAAMWQNTYLKGGQPSHGVIQLDSTGRKIVVPKGSASSIPSKFRKREQGFLASHYDDEGWWGLAWQDVYDLTGVQDYLTESIAIWQDMNAGWGNLNCGGLPWFKGEAKTDNPLAIPNELYLAISASLANRVPSSQKQTYLSAAQTVWAWFEKVGFINSQGLVNDAVNGNTCVNDNNQPIWTYNQGVIIGGLADLYIATGDSSYLTSASQIANATMAHLVDNNGILADSCDLSHSCSGDNLQFKGVFARNLQKLYQSQPSPAYKAFLEKNAQSIWQNDLAVEAGDCFNGADWSGPYVVGSATASSQSSALQCLVAALSEDAMKYINNQTLLLPFRAQFAYSNLCYELAGHVIAALSGQSYFDFVQTRIFDPLGMSRTFLKTPPASIDNRASCYNTLDDLSTVPIPCAKTGDDWFGGPTGGLRSCVRDLLKLYRAFLTSYNDQFSSGKSSTEGSPLKQVTHLMSAKIPMDQPSRNEASYALGWGRVQLPGKMGQIGINPGLLPNGMPTIAKGVPGQLVIFHQGSLPGALTIAILVPDKDVAIVVLTNSLALNDVPDWIGQLILEEVLKVPPSERVDFIKSAEACVPENLRWYPELIKELKDTRKNDTVARDLEEYVGTYWDDIRTFKIVVTLEQGKLHWAFQGLDSEKFELNHYEDDTFLWLAPRNELSRRGRWVGSDQGPDFWKAKFKAASDAKVDKLYWSHDQGVPPVEYTKE